MTADYRAALEAVRAALDLPYAATCGGDEVREKLLGARLLYVNHFLRAVLDGPHLDLDFEIRFLAEWIAKLPAADYVTDIEAQAAMAQGATWTEAVTIPDPTTEGEQR